MDSGIGKGCNMRLTAEARHIIRATTHEIFGEQAQVRLFGSRIDDNQRGGDIDLLVELPNPQKESRKKSLALVARLQMRLGDQPIDVLVIDPETALQPVHLMAAATGEPI
jgi:predicted nucleotidyltransferase